ncbi:AAC(3) family N-acetyltransferase [Ahniella affigens]|uniref:AAC(3) family N-acetyltransferase n=1 Tax=Ahniella affigens TaxID=2021234 RepID=UPI0011B1CB9E|nr:AAC(3) family N-acetyltransferase [Ahniella affigens]
MGHKELEIDCAKVYVLESDAWEIVRAGMPFLDRDISPSFVASGAHELEFVASHQNEFCFGLDRRGRLKKWGAVILYKYDSEWIRVHVERDTCKHCGWAGLIALAAEPALYFGTPDPEAAFDRAWNRRVVGCPLCGNALPRRPVWVEAAKHAMKDSQQSRHS